MGKIYANLPLAHDHPIHFGVKEFCAVCRRCADACPVKAISQGAAPEVGGHSRSNIKGVRKWTIHAEKCLAFWTAQNRDCAICLRVCPYNKDYRMRRYRLGRWLAGTRLRRLMLRLDIRLGYGERVRLERWWRGLRAAPGTRLRKLLPGGASRRGR